MRTLKQWWYERALRAEFAEINRRNGAPPVSDRRELEKRYNALYDAFDAALDLLPDQMKRDIYAGSNAHPDYERVRRGVRVLQGMREREGWAKTALRKLRAALD